MKIRFVLNTHSYTNFITCIFTHFNFFFVILSFSLGFCNNFWKYHPVFSHSFPFILNNVFLFLCYVCCLKMCFFLVFISSSLFLSISIRLKCTTILQLNYIQYNIIFIHFFFCIFFISFFNKSRTPNWAGNFSSLRAERKNLIKTL